MQGIIKFVFSQQMKHSALSSASASVFAYVVATVGEDMEIEVFIQYCLLK